MQEDSFFEIELPLPDVPCEDNPFLIHCKYRVAAYAGQMLAHISWKFSYLVPSISSTPIFRFRCSGKDRKKFADKLFLILCGCYITIGTNHHLWVKFHDGLGKFLNGKGKDTTGRSIWRLIEMADKYCGAVGSGWAWCWD